MDYSYGDWFHDKRHAFDIHKPHKVGMQSAEK